MSKLLEKKVNVLMKEKICMFILFQMIFLMDNNKQQSRRLVALMKTLEC